MQSRHNVKLFSSIHTQAMQYLYKFETARDKKLRVLHIYSNVTRKSVIIVFVMMNIWPYNHVWFLRFI